MDLILDEIRSVPVLPLHVPVPQNRRLKRVCESVKNQPGEVVSVDEAARLARMSRRAFTRLFRHETGMSFGDSSRQVRLLTALTRLGLGEAVTTIALDLGYENPGAFTAMFRRGV